MAVSTFSGGDAENRRYRSAVARANTNTNNRAWSEWTLEELHSRLQYEIAEAISGRCGGENLEGIQRELARRQPFGSQGIVPPAEENHNGR